MQKCKRCRKSISSFIKSGYCRKCYQYIANKKLIQRRRENKLCLCCGTKIKPKTIYPVRCDKCNERAKKLKSYKINKIQKHDNHNIR